MQFTKAQEAPNETQQSLEILSENGEDNDIDDDSYQLTLQQFIKNPIDINTTTDLELRELKLISPLQISSFLSYRKLYGPFIDIYELQAVPNWDVELLDRIKPFITINAQNNTADDWRKRLQDGKFSWVARVSEVVEKSKGFTTGNTVGNRYLGSPQRIWTRFRYQYQNQFQYGILAEKDAGEQFFKGKNKNGFDFYSAHIFLRQPKGILQTLAIGDYTVNMGQGLIQWQSLAFKKSPDVLRIKRESAIIRPYLSAGEFNFHRGLASTFRLKNLNITGFVSVRKLDANVVDTLNNEEIVSGFLTSGLHRTKNELADKNMQTQTTIGGSIQHRSARGHFGVNGLHYNFANTINRRGEPYQRYYIEGKNWYNFSTDFGYTYKNVHIFGELATSKQNGFAGLTGALISLAKNVDATLLYRNINPQFQSLTSSAVTEASTVSNEKGLLMGFNIKIAQPLIILGYFDVYSSPFLRYRLDAPSRGYDILSGLQFKPNSKIEAYTRIRTESKAVNESSSQGLTIRTPINRIRTNWRTNVSVKINDIFTLRSRFEIVWWDKKGTSTENGNLAFFDVLYKPMMSKISASGRIQFFDTDGYNSRIYAYENDVLYSYSIPVFYDRGSRYYINVNYDLTKKISLWARFAQFIYANRTSIGSGLDEIPGNKRSDWKLQLQWNF